MKALRRSVLIVLLAVLAAGALAPFLSADRLRPRIRAALEAALNRRVEIGAVHLNLFTGPGFTVERVVIGDDPAAGVEPFAYVESMRARVRLTSLLAGKLAFSSLHLDAPSVNLVRTPEGAWNVQPWLDRPLAAKSAPQTFPDIQISGGRLNFKFGDTKSIFYISEADVDVYPNEQGELVLRFSGVPARTDRGSQTFGQISARGLLRAGPHGAERLTMGVRLERTSMSEIVQLFDARDLGVHGFTIAEAQLAGPLDKIEVTGSLNINDIHRWDLMPSHGEGWTMHYRGVLDLNAHRLDLETFANEGQPQPVSIQLGIGDYLANANWDASIRFHDLPAASLVETARHMGAPLADGVQVDGKINGAIGYSNRNGLEGELLLESASVKFPQSVSAVFDSARLAFTNKNVTLDPVSVQLDNDQSAAIQGQYAFDNSHASFRITSPQLTIAEVEGGADRLGETPPIPLLGELRQGTWRGWIAFDRKDDGAGVWTGEYEVQNGLMDIPGLASPVRLASASVEMKQNQIQISRMRARVGSVRLEGEYRYDPKAAEPNLLRLRIPELKLAELERLMLPTLHRSESFLARTFRRNPPLPKWLENRSLDASIQIASVLNGDAQMGQFQARMKWLGPRITLSDAQLDLDPMHAAGDVTVSLTKAFPSYRLSGNIENLSYRDGQLDVDGELDTSGIGQNLLLNVQSEGTFEGRQIALAPDAQVDAISGAYRIAPLSGLPRLVLSNLQVALGQDSLVGQGASQADGRIVLELMSGHKPVRLTGMLLPVHPER
ncbi:MAG TPA: AsmA family protein [Bryobacteraceae bacterium]|nr:AsmA family protein [Bryobacteraceae bacterium]